MLALESYELAQIRNEKSVLRLLKETEIIELIIENKSYDIIKEAIRNDKNLYQDLLDDFMLEQVRRDQWSRQWGFLLENLGYEEIRYDKNLQEGFMGDLMIDILWTALPPLIRGAGTFFTGGAGSLPAHILAGFVASGGCVYYAWHALKAADEDRLLDCMFNVLNALFSLEQAKIPGISAAIATAGRAAMKVISKFFNFIATPFKALYKMAQTGFVRVGNTKIAKTIYEPIAKFFTEGVGKILPESSGAIKSVSEKSGKLTEFFTSQVERALKDHQINRHLTPDQVASLEAILSRFKDEIVGPMTQFTEQFATKVQNIDGAIARAGSIESESVHKACHELLEVMNTASGTGGVIENVIQPLAKKELQNLERQYFAEAATQLGKTAGLAAEKEIAHLFSVFGKEGMEKVAQEASTALASEGIKITVGAEGKLLAQGVNKATGVAYGTAKPFSEFLSSTMRFYGAAELGVNKSAADIYKKMLGAIANSSQYKEFLVDIGKASPELARKISLEGTSFLQSVAESFDVTRAITEHYHKVLKDPSIITKAGYTGRIGPLKIEKYMSAWVKSQYPNFKAWGKLAKVFQIGVGAGTAGTKGASQSYAEITARRKEQEKLKARKIEKEKESSIKGRQQKKEEEAEVFDSMRMR